MGIIFDHKISSDPRNFEVVTFLSSTNFEKVLIEHLAFSNEIFFFHILAILGKSLLAFLKNEEQVFIFTI